MFPTTFNGLFSGGKFSTKPSHIYTNYDIKQRRFGLLLTLPLETNRCWAFGFFSSVAIILFAVAIFLFAVTIFLFAVTIFLSAVAIILNRIAIYYFLHALNLNVICVFLTLQLII